MFLRLAAIVLALAVLAPAGAQAWIHDTNENKIDDRIEAVHTEGLAAAFEDGDVTERMTIGVFEGQPSSFAVYVGYDHHPTEADASVLQLQSLVPVKPYLYIDYIRAQATFAQIQLIAGIPGVTRVEAVPMVYAANHWGSRVVRARDSRGLTASEDYAMFPSARAELGLDGTGIVIGVLDTGVNDDVDEINADYPGHESLNGKFLGGGEFYFGQPLLNTGLDESMNPQDHGGAASSYHATHVAGSAMGTGGPDGFFRGVAPAARLVDCKVLSDAGAGFGSADGVEWCIHNRDNDWGLTGADTVYSGIDVLNLSLGGATASDGTDAGSQMMNAAVAAGLVVCIATGNDGNIDYMPAPASADDCIAVGASTHLGSLDPADDLVTGFSNEGPRLDDGDGDRFDEMKPSVCAPGAGILSADGDFLGDGTGYHGLSGTSMATPHVAGVAALVRQANPALPASAVKRILENTAHHGIGTQKAARAGDPFGVDPNYNPADGWGSVDAYAAALEAMNPASGVQVVRFRPVARPGDLEIDVHWWTQREYPFQGFHVSRASDVEGAPGTFVRITTVLIPGAGDPDIDADDNRELYTYVDDDPALDLGTRYWYRVEWVDLGGTPHAEPPAPVIFGELPRVMTAYYSIVHNAPDNDLFIRVGTSASRDPDDNEFFVVGASEALRDSFIQSEPTNTVTATPGDRESFWSIGFSDLDLDPLLRTPTVGQPWFLNVTEGGYVNRFGRLTGFSIFVHDFPGSETGTTYVSDTPPPVVTLETLQSTMWIPEPNAAAVALAALDVQGAHDGIRIRVEVEPGSDVAGVHLFRARTDDFAAREPVAGAPRGMSGLEYEYVDTTAEPGVRYWYWAQLTGRDGGSAFAGPISAKSLAPDLRRTTILPASPNPVAGQTRFAYRIGEDVAAGGTVPVIMTLHDVQGRMVRMLRNTVQGEGAYQVSWDARDDAGRRVPGGIYYQRFRAGSVVRTSKVTVVN